MAAKLPQVPVDAQASEAVDSTLAEPVPAAAALSSALHEARRAQSDSEVPEDCTVDCLLLRLARFAICYFAGLYRSLPKRAAAREICLHMRRDPNTSYPRMGRWILRNRLRLTAINMI